MNTRTDKDFRNAIDLIEKSEHILITTHRRPDGDACGCVAAMGEALKQLGKNVTPLLLSSVPKWYEFLFDVKVPILGEDIQLDELTAGGLGEFDLIVIVDTNSTSQLPEFDEFLKHNDKPILVIDHHATADGLGDVELIDSTAAATALIVLDLFKYADWDITRRVAEALFVAVATDTGWFQFSNTDSRTYRACAELIEAGAKPTPIHDTLYHKFSPARFRLMTRMLNSLELHLDNRYAAMVITQQDFKQSGATYKDTEDLINECNRITTVKVSALFVELKDARIRCSLRSKGTVDICRIAQKFGGGGHKMAAGTYLPGPIENAKQVILEHMEKQLAQTEVQLP